jgi:hypothetical protein
MHPLAHSEFPGEFPTVYNKNEAPLCATSNPPLNTRYFSKKKVPSATLPATKFTDGPTRHGFSRICDIVHFFAMRAT